MDPDKRNIGAVDSAFERGTVWQAPDAQLEEYMQTLATGHVPNEMVRHREIIRSMTINYIQMSRLIKRIDEEHKHAAKASDRLSRLVMVLTIVATVAGIAQVVLAIFHK